MRRLVWLIGMGGCGASLVGPGELAQRIDTPAPPGDPAWEVRWVSGDGLVVGCERVPAELVGRLAVSGSVPAVPPEMPEPAVWNVESTFRWALGLPVLVEAGSPWPPAGTGALEAEAGVFGTTAPLAWLVVDGEPADAGAQLGIGPLDTGWVEVLVDRVTAQGDWNAGLEPWTVEDDLFVTSLGWGEDESLDLWSGETTGGIARSCP